jgi:hypothetical protein
MPKVSPIQTNFTAGELSPQLEGRVDVSRYFNAVSSMENFLIAPYGGADRRPGSQYVAPAKFPDKKCRLIPFEFSTEQTYILEFGHLYIRFFRDEGTVTEAAKTITGATNADPVNLTITAHGYSVGDEIIIDDTMTGMTELNGKRFRVDTVPGANNITIEDLDGVTVDGTGFGVYAAGGTASKVYEIVSPYTEDQLFDIQHAQSADVLYTVHIDVQQQKLERFGDTNWTISAIDTVGGPYQPVNLDDTLTLTPSATTGTITVTASSPVFNADMVGGLIRIGGLVSSVQGYVKITVFGSTTSVTAVVQETLDGTGATDDWSLGSFSDDAGYPTTVAFHEQRLWYGATKLEPQTVFGSVTLEFENFTPGSDDTSGLDYQIATEQVNAIRWISSGRGLAIGTTGGAFILSTGSDFTPITPTNVQVRRETNFGSELIGSQVIGNFQYYVQRGGRKIREFAYAFDIDRHKSTDQTLLAEHITESTIVNMDYQQSPSSILWCVRADGEIATLTRQIDQEVTGWCRQIAGATVAGDSLYESVATIPVGEDNQVWVSVKRTVNSVVRRHVEFLKPLDFGTDQADAFYVDSGLTYEGVATDTLTGLDHLEGETVTVLSEGAVLRDVTVTNGSITLLPTGITTTKAHVGLKYLSELEGLRIEGGSRTGTGQGKIKRIYEITFRFYRTGGGEFGTRDNTDVIQFRTSANPMNQPVPLFTGDKRLPYPKGYDRDAKVYIKQEQPLPMTVLAIMPKMEVFDR